MLLSIVAAAPEGADVPAFVDALTADGALHDGEVEVIIVQLHDPGSCVQAATIAFETLERQCSIFELWGAGVRKARAQAIALLDARCPPAEGWLRAVRAQLPLQVPAMFGPVACGVDIRTPDIVGYLVEYAQFAPPLDPDLSEVPGLNLIVARDVAHAPSVLREDGFAKTRLLSALGRSQVPRPIPQAIVQYRKHYDFAAYCAHRYRHARCYAADRSMPSILARARAPLSAPLLPALRVWRILRSVRRQPSHAKAARRYLHRILIAETAWALGELTGYLFGAGQTRRHLR